MSRVTDAVAIADFAIADVAHGHGSARDARVRVSCCVEFWGGPLDGDMSDLTVIPTEGNCIPDHDGAYWQDGPMAHLPGIMRMRWDHRPRS